MKKITLAGAARFILFAFPCYIPIALMIIALCIWRVGLNEPDLIQPASVSVVIIASAVLLAKNIFWVCIPMMLLGLYIFLRDDIGGLYGAYIMLHYAACLIYFYKNRKNSGLGCIENNNVEDS